MQIKATISAITTVSKNSFFYLNEFHDNSDSNEAFWQVQQPYEQDFDDGFKELWAYKCLRFSSNTNLLSYQNNLKFQTLSQFIEIIAKRILKII